MNNKQITCNGLSHDKKALGSDAKEQNGYLKCFDSDEFNATPPQLTDEEFATITLYLVALDYCKELYYAFCTAPYELKRGDYVVALTRYGIDVIRVAGVIKNRPQHLKQKDMIYIQRPANENEMQLFRENQTKVFDANKIFREKVQNNGLDMRLVTSHFLVPEPKVLFFFTADSRVDFRRLVKDLVAVFRRRVELRQIATRDESKIAGGLGQCGRPFCCCASYKMPNVSTKMARDQRFSLVSQKASGPCAKLMCCLSFEHEWYVSEHAKFPPRGFRFSVGESTFVVDDVNMVIDSIIVVDQQARSFKASAKNFHYVNNSWQADPAYFSNLN